MEVLVATVADRPVADHAGALPVFRHPQVAGAFCDRLRDRGATPVIETWDAHAVADHLAETDRTDLHAYIVEAQAHDLDDAIAVAAEIADRVPLDPRLEQTA